MLRNKKSVPQCNVEQMEGIFFVVPNSLQRQQQNGSIVMNEAFVLAKENISLLSDMEPLLNGDMNDLANDARLVGIATSCVDRLSIEEQDAMVTATRAIFPRLNTLRERLLKVHQAVWNANRNTLQ